MRLGSRGLARILLVGSVALGLGGCAYPAGPYYGGYNYGYGGYGYSPYYYGPPVVGSVVIGGGRGWHRGWR